MLGLCCRLCNGILGLGIALGLGCGLRAHSCSGLLGILLN